MPGSGALRGQAANGSFRAEGYLGAREHTFGNPFPFTKRLRHYLTDEQHAVLEALPPVAASLDSAIDGYVALAGSSSPGPST